MAEDFNPNASERYPPGINLAHYYPQKRSGNKVRYVHKKFLQQSTHEKIPTPNPSKEKLEKDVNKVGNKNKTKKKKKGVNTDDKSVQFNSEAHSNVWKDNKNTVTVTNESVLGETIKFAKNIVPLVIPPNGQNDSTSSVYYTVKVSQKSNKRQKNHDKSEAHDITFKREKTKKVVETYRNERICSQRESLSVKETVSFGSQNNTLDEIHNPSLCCSLSEISEKKHHKKERTDKNVKHNDLLKLAASESFEAIASELVNHSGEAKVKIHLMKDADKKIFSESIKVPLLNAIKECFIELNKCNSTLNTEITTVQKYVTCNTEKLDNAIEKLSCIEKKIYDLSKDRIKANNARAKSPKAQVYRPSTLESLGQDLPEVKEEGEDSSERECYEEDLTERRKNRERSAIVHLKSKIVENEVENSARRQAAGEESSTSRFESGQLLAKLERPNRTVPARFCWTDASRKV